MMMNSASVHFDWVAENDAKPRRLQRSFHSQLIKLHREWIPHGSRVLEVGCGGGVLLGSLEPAQGVGIDISPAMIGRARALNLPNCEFNVADIGEYRSSNTFDYIVASYLTGYLPDVQRALERMQSCAGPRTRLHLTSLNTLWLYPLKFASRAGVVMPQPPSNWLSRLDLINLLELAGWEVISTTTEQLFPFNAPGIASLLNRFLVRLPFFRHFGITISITARPRRRLVKNNSSISCSVVVPARNEVGNIEAALRRIPKMGSWTEVIFVEGNSKDDTWGEIQKQIASYSGFLKLRALKQPGRGKWDAVRVGLDEAKGDIVVIQDADLTAPPEELKKFFDSIISGTAEFANGSRLVYPMEEQAMRFLNLLGNKFFAWALSYTLGQPIKDSLCGTKMLLRSDYLRIKARIVNLGDFDPFGDFNLLFGAALLNLKIRDIPVRYKDRVYGETNISRFSHGWLLLKMTIFGLFRVRWR